MSTGAAPQSADLAPPYNDHARGHSRTRGHTRSRQWTQPPSPLSLENSNGGPTKPTASNDTANLGRPYSHAAQSTYSLHSSSPSYTIPQHNRNHSVTPILVDAAHDHDSKEELATSRGYSSEQMQEVLTGAVIALPWIALSWCSRSYAQASRPGKDGDIMRDVTSTGQKACLLTAITLLLFGCGQMLRMNHRQGSSISRSPVKLPPLNLRSVQTAVLQAFSIGLPTYAALKIGGFIVAFALLLATASGVPSLMDATPAVAPKEKYSRKTLTISLIGGSTLLSYFGMNQPWDSSPLLGYMTLLLSAFALAPPFPAIRWREPITESGLVAESLSKQTQAADAIQSSVIVTMDASLALFSGGSLALLYLIISRASPFSTAELLYVITFSGLFALSLTVSVPSGLRSPDKVGLAASLGAAALLCSPHAQDEYLLVYAGRGILAAASFFASRMDDSQLRIDARSHNHSRSHHGHSHSSTETSAFTKWLIHQSEAYSLLNSILKEKDSRSIFYFMCLNFAFMLVQLSYGFLTGSLGLLSDSIHMFFDCLALVVGLCAAVMSKWPPNARFPYGYGKVDTLSGFANGIFLMIISVEIIYEAVERLSSGSQMHRIGELLIVSIAGLLVNLVGIFSFEHGHHHGHDHGHGHGHSHGNENMHGIFLHILADTLGSVAVVISTVLVHYSGWSGYDPLASCLIAILIFVSAVPLVSSTAKTLLLTLPADTEYNVRETLAGVSTLRGIVGYTVPKFWLDDTGAGSLGHTHGPKHSADGGCGHRHNHSPHHDHDHDRDHDHNHTHNHHHNHDHAHEDKSQKVFGVIHVIASRGSDLEDVRQRTVNYLQEKGMDIVVQVERDGDGRCWCGGGNKSS